MAIRRLKYLNWVLFVLVNDGKQLWIKFQTKKWKKSELKLNYFFIICEQFKRSLAASFASFLYPLLVE